ncbi:MAG: hybrid sensor histidine kinase/response regulator [Pseudomonadota bacterium]
MSEPRDNLHATLEDEILLLLSSQVTHAPVAVILAMSLVAAIASSVVPPIVWASWLVLVVLLQLVRVWLYRRLPTLSHHASADRLKCASIMNVVITIAHSLPLFLLVELSPYDRAVMSMIWMGLGIGSILTTAGYRPFTRAHVFITLVPLFALWAWCAIGITGATSDALIALIGSAYSYTLLTVSNRIFSVYRDNFEIRQQLQQALESEERASQSKTRFLAAASHDLRQPIHNLSLFSSALMRRSLDEKSLDIAQHINTAVTTLTAELDALLDMSKLDAGVVAVNKQNLYLQPLIQRIMDELSPEAEASGYTFHLNCPDEALVFTDPILLERIIRNVVHNSLHHTDPGAITIAFKSESEEELLQIGDSGPGIPKEEHERVFEEFYQLHNPHRDRTKGLGLGLSIVSRLASLLDIDMAFESSPTSGTTFWFAFERGDSKEQDEQVALGSNDSVIEGLRILVVDDEHEVREAMTSLLDALGCPSTSVDSTVSAIDQLTYQDFDVALVDMRLRDNDDGLETYRQIREKDAKLPVIFITADTAPHRIQQAHSVGVPILHKPVLVDSLKRAIHFVSQH